MDSQPITLAYNLYTDMLNTFKCFTVGAFISHEI